MKLGKIIENFLFAVQAMRKGVQEEQHFVDTFVDTQRYEALSLQVEID